MKQQWHVQTMINSWIDGWFEGQYLGICRKNAIKGIEGNLFSFLFSATIGKGVPLRVRLEEHKFDHETEKYHQRSHKQHNLANL